MHEGSLPIVVVGTTGEARVSLLRLLDSGHADVDLIQRATLSSAGPSSPAFYCPLISDETCYQT